jgi:hypothetical protein
MARATSATPPTYTHVGGRAAVGYQASGKDFIHYLSAEGRMHALNACGYRNFKALCGVCVGEDTDDDHDIGGRNPIVKASAGRVTCKRCLAKRPTVAPPSKRVEYRAMYEDSSGNVSCWAKGRTRAEVSGWENMLVSRQDAIRVWVEEVEIVTTY